MGDSWCARNPLRPLAAAVMALFGLGTTTATAAPPVTNCNDAGDGSLRSAILGAADPDTIDLSQLQCTISLSSGALVATQKDLTINGPGSGKLTIDGSSDTTHDGIFLHNGSGTLELDHMTVNGGYKYLNDATRHTGGGCIFSSGGVVLTGSTVSNCQMVAGPNSHAFGGGIYAGGGVILSNSVVTGNSTFGSGSVKHTFGGGIFAKGAVIIDNSTVSSNGSGYGGGVYGLDTMVMTNATVSANRALEGGGVMSAGPIGLAYSTVSANNGGGIWIQLSGSPQPSTIQSSTISGNFVFLTGFPGVLSNGPLYISNSTIAFNSAPPGRYAVVVTDNNTLDIESSIIAENLPGDVDVPLSTTVSGSNNLITVSHNVPAQVITLSACPQLLPLADNGGPTLTHALRHSSPAIDAGANPYMAAHDQRGAGYLREFGAGADIGAFEWHGELEDSVFRNDFDYGAAYCDL